MVIPASALRKVGASTRVSFVVRDSKLEDRICEVDDSIGAAPGDAEAHVLQGLKDGERIVVKPTPTCATASARG